LEQPFERAEVVILYQNASQFHLYASTGQTFEACKRQASGFCRTHDKFYILDGKEARPLITLFISYFPYAIFGDCSMQQQIASWSDLPPI
jgi:hypothetical protein